MQIRSLDLLRPKRPKKMLNKKMAAVYIRSYSTLSLETKTTQLHYKEVQNCT